MARITKIGEAGFTYPAALFLLVVLMIMSARALNVWKTSEQHAREQELLWVGQQYRQAIKTYYELSPGSEKRYPSDLRDLLEHRFTTQIRRPLRRPYRDPITNRAEWGVVTAPDGGVMGVYSLSMAEPLKKGGFEESNAEFANKKHYQDWQFIYQPAK
ncbi:type II secretion system protein [Chitinimonas sp.]|uniref:type II secretion system protein n=1 Tax=Chitinimonas sp. TaxID=1934313 RepID=UPI0035B40EBA